MYEDDKNSRNEWEEAYTDGLDLGVKTENVQRLLMVQLATHPILNEATIRFVSQAMMEIFPLQVQLRHPL